MTAVQTHLTDYIRGHKILVVDLDGTLIDTEPTHRRSYELILSALLGVDVSLSYATILGRPGAEIWRGLLNAYGLDLDPARLNALRKVVVTGLLAVRTADPHVGLIDALRQFAGSKILLTTQTEESARTYVSRLHLDNVFDDIVSTQRAGQQRSKVALIRAFAEQQHVALGQIAWVEDASPELVEAKALGIAVVVVRREYNRESVAIADCVI